MRRFATPGPPPADQGLRWIKKSQTYPHIILVIVHNPCRSRVSIAYSVHLPPDILSLNDSPKAG